MSPGPTCRLRTGGLLAMSPQSTFPGVFTRPDDLTDGQIVTELAAGWGSAPRHAAIFLLVSAAITGWQLMPPATSCS